tara:strand:- start:415 stop:765 length:351 start_codon:yes stop_codon:yes gene_type:complete
MANHNNVILDSLFGAVLMGSISAAANRFSESPNFEKILGFLWAAPLTLGYLAHVMMQTKPEGLSTLMRHMLIGTVITLVLEIVVIAMKGRGPVRTVIWASVIATTCIYFLFFRAIP